MSSENMLASLIALSWRTAGSHWRVGNVVNSQVLSTGQRQTANKKRETTRLDLAEMRKWLALPFDCAKPEGSLPVLNLSHPFHIHLYRPACAAVRGGESESIPPGSYLVCTSTHMRTESICVQSLYYRGRFKFVSRDGLQISAIGIVDCADVQIYSHVT